MGEASAGTGSADSSAEEDLPNRGTVSSQSASFQQYSAEGKLHLAEFGEESSGDDRGAVETVIEPYLETVAAGEWAEACAYLLADARANVTQLAEAKGKGGGCAEALPVAIASAGDSRTPVLAPEGIASLRIEKGGRAGAGAGFALFHAGDGEDRWIAVKVEDGSWKILSIAPQSFR
jgi:hypothetical protein